MAILPSALSTNLKSDQTINSEKDDLTIAQRQYIDKIEKEKKEKQKQFLRDKIDRKIENEL
jgi:hypothetical protein